MNRRTFLVVMIACPGAAAAMNFSSPSRALTIQPITEGAMLPGQAILPPDDMETVEIERLLSRCLLIWSQADGPEDHVGRRGVFP